MSYFLKNTRLFEARFPDFRRLRKAPIPRNHITVVPSESGVPTIIAGGKTLHSRIDPLSEAQSFVASQSIRPEQGVLLLGLGLGYHLNALVERLDRHQSLCVVEPDLGVFLAALDYNDFARVADHPNLYFILGGDAQTAADEIRRVWMRNGMRDLCTVIHWPSVRRAPDYYEAIQASVRALGSDSARRSLAYPKLADERLKILFFDAGFLLQKECAKAMRALGHKVVFFRGEDAKGELREDFVDQFREAALAYRPDVVFTINHKGFDKRGDLTHMLEVLELPLISWFVDSPTVVHQGSRANASPWVQVFTWERSYIAPLKALGFERVEYLPLATDPDLFRPHEKLPKKKTWLGGEIAFVGNSMIEARTRWENKAPFLRRLGPLIDRIVDAQLADRRRPASEVVAEALEGDAWRPASERERADLEAAAIIEATLRYRLRVAASALDKGLEVYGDEHWQALLPGYGRLRPMVDYYEDLPYLYRFHDFNLNATSLQMDTAVNQRVFDAAACAAFLITDDQEDLELLFDPRDEIVRYESPEEIPELIDYYRANPRARDRVREAAHFRVKREHTYRRRIEAALAKVREAFGARCSAVPEAAPDAAAWDRAA